MVAWAQLPYSTEFFINGVGFALNFNTFVDDNGFYIYLNAAQSGLGATFVNNNHIPAEIRIVLIPEGQVNTIQSIQAGLLQSTAGWVPR